MALLMVEGFDKYGAVNSNAAGVATLLTAGEWTTANATALSIVAPLSANGLAVSIAYNAATNALAKTLPASYGRLIGGIRFNVIALSGSAHCGVAFQDAGTTQCCITINATTGTISLRNSDPLGTALATSGASVSTGTTHYLEWDITFGNTAAYQVWLDGVSLFSGTGDTTTTANNTANGFSFLGRVSGSTIGFDDLYLFDTTGTTNNAVLLTSPRIETQFPTSDGAVQFAVGAGILGTSVARTTSNASPTANSLYLRRFTSPVACTLSSISLVSNQANAGASWRGVVYTDSSGAAGALMSSGTLVTGIAVTTPLTLPLTTPQSLSAGTSYWLGFINDTAVNLTQGDINFLSYRANNTFASGAPGTAPAMTAGQATTHMWGNLTSVTGNWYQASQNPTNGAYDYVFDATVGHEDLYNFPALSAPPSAIYAVAVKASLSKSDAGAKTASVRLKSGATDSAGTGGTALAPGTSYGWMTSHYPTDPATSVAWTLGGLNSAQAGVKVET